MRANQIVLVVVFQMVLFIDALGIWRKPHLWYRKGETGAEEVINELCPTKALKEAALNAAQIAAETTNNTFYLRRAQELVKNQEEECLNWKMLELEKFDKDFKKRCR